MPSLSLENLLSHPLIAVLDTNPLNSSPTINHITLDSRQCTSQSIFVALCGQNVDGRRFINGTVSPVILVESWSDEWQASLNESRWILQTSDARAIMAEWACQISGNPSKKLHMIGITGTNGKTTSTWMLSHILQEANIGSVATIGTIGHRIDGVALPNSMGFTTPESPGLQRSLDYFVEQGCSTCIMEVSSIGLMMQRVGGIVFDIAAFTNFTQDHLDIHGSMEQYLQEKRKLFQFHVSKQSVSLLMTNHPLVSKTPVHHGEVEYLSTSDAPNNDWWVSDKRYSVTGTHFNCHHQGDVHSIYIPLIGEHNIENALIAISAAKHTGINWLQITTALRTLPQTPGRLQYVHGRYSGHAFVDYAHTPDALEQSLTSLRKLCLGKLWVVFGCGGDRDTSKRPVMGCIAVQVADHTIVTSDNPRTEAPLNIIQDIVNGIPKAKHDAISVLIDREQAIHHALERMLETDVLLVAGKGHENYQIIGNTKHHFDDCEVIKLYPDSYNKP